MHNFEMNDRWSIAYDGKLHHVILTTGRPTSAWAAAEIMAGEAAAEYLARHDLEIYLADAVAQLLRHGGPMHGRAPAAAFLAQYFR